MSNRVILGTMLTLLLVSMFSLALNIQPARAEGTIYIRADGSIDPPDAPISTVDYVTYTFTGNITSDADGVVVERSNVIIDGNGYTLQGTRTGYGLFLNGRSNVTIKGTQITNFEYGMFLNYSVGNTIYGNIVTNNQMFGILLWKDSNSNIVASNAITNNNYGIDLGYSKNNDIVSNNISHNSYGVSGRFSSSKNNIVNNTVENNVRNGVEFYGWDYSENVIISNNTITSNGWGGIWFVSSASNNTVIGNHIAENGYSGIELHSSNHNLIANNTITDNTDDGVLLESSYENLIIKNNVTSNHKYGLNMVSSNNTIFHNNFFGNVRRPQAYVAASVSDVWDDGYQSGGNYWSDYSGVDANGDGIGDAPYVIDADNKDRYPLIHPWSPLPVHNINTGLGYATIQGAIDANETLEGHTLFAEAGTYYENIVVNKPVSLFGENRDTTIIDGRLNGNTVTVLDGVKFGGFTVKNCGRAYYWLSGIMLSGSSNNTIFGNKVVDNLNGISLLSSSNNIILDNNVRVAGWDGIYIKDSLNNTIGGNNVADNGDGIILYGSSSNIISGNNVTDNLFYGILLTWLSNNNVLTDNTVAYTDNDGLRLFKSSNNMIFHNSFVNNSPQVSTSDSLENVWEGGYPSGGNYWSDCTGIDAYNGPYQNETGSDGIGDSARVIDASNIDNYPLIHLYGSIQNLNTSLVYLTVQSAIDAPETVNGHTIFVRNGAYTEHVVVNKSISLIGECRDATIIDGSNYGAVVKIVEDNVTVTGFTAQNSGSNSFDAGIQLSFSNYSIICNNAFIHDEYGLSLWESSDNIIHDNFLDACTEFGIHAGQSNGNALYSNTVVNTSTGLYLFRSLANIVYNNAISGARYCGLVLSESQNNTLRSNTIRNCSNGIELYSGAIPPLYCAFNTIIDNEIENNSLGVKIEDLDVHDNTFNHNNFINNSDQVFLANSSSNKWDNGYPSGGNYWSDYTGTDFYNGLCQNETGSDGIGDTPYVIDAYNRDNYPLLPQRQYLPIAGDLNLDGVVDILDAVQAASAFGSYPGHPRWNSHADLNHDNEVDIFDIIILPTTLENISIWRRQCQRE